MTVRFQPKATETTPLINSAPKPSATSDVSKNPSAAKTSGYVASLFNAIAGAKGYYPIKR